MTTGAELEQLRHLYFGDRFDVSIAATVYRHEADAAIDEIIRLREVEVLLAADLYELNGRDHTQSATIIRLRGLLAALPDDLPIAGNEMRGETWYCVLCGVYSTGRVEPVQHAPDCLWPRVLAEREE